MYDRLADLELEIDEYALERRELDVARPYFSATQGYQMLWPFCGVPILLAIPLVYRLIAVEPSGTPEPVVA